MLSARLQRLGLFSMSLSVFGFTACGGNEDPDGQEDKSEKSDSDPSQDSEHDSEDDNASENSSNKSSTDDEEDTDEDDSSSESSEDDENDEDSSEDDDSSTDDSETSSDDDDNEFDDGEYVEGIRLTGLEVNQGVAILVAEDGAPTDPSDRRNELVRNRGALVRAIYSVDDWGGGAVEGRLLLEHSDGKKEVVVATKDIDADSDLTKLGGTLEWRLKPEQMTAGVKYAVGLFVPDSKGSSTPNADARIPSADVEEMGVPDRLMRIEIVLVKADTTLEFTDENVAAMAEVFYEHSPLEVDQIDITVREQGVNGGGSLDSCLSAVKQARSADNPDPHVYYLGLIAGNIGGLSDLSGPTMQDASRRTSCNFNGQAGAWPWDANQIAVHEVGHAAGSYHTPGCGAAGTVDDYPDLDGEGVARLGVWGYSLAQDKLYAPDEYGDIMCYCRPHWTGVYTYQKWTDRISILSSWPQFGPSSDSRSLPRTEILWGIRGPERTQWWIAPDVMPVMPIDANISVSYQASDQRSTAIAYRDLLADEDYEMIAIPLGSELGDMKDLEIRAFGKSYRFADPSTLRAGYEAARAGR